VEILPDQIELYKLRNRLTKRFHKACSDYALIKEGDHILIGLSGGKDSLALTELLGMRQKVYVPRFQVTAVHIAIHEMQYTSDVAYLKEFCDGVGVPFLYREVHIQELPAPAPKEKNHCFVCSWYRRKALFSVAKELGCNKIALGHHKDDVVETLLMNLIYQGAFASMPPMLQMEKFPMQIIRPICLIEEADLVRYAELSEYHNQVKQCPFEHESSRTDIKKLLQMLEQFNPNIRSSLWQAMENIKSDYLPRHLKTK